MNPFKAGDKVAWSQAPHLVLEVTDVKGMYVYTRYGGVYMYVDLIKKD